jgi:uncharacterized phage protein (TIGR01671 family)
MREIRFRAWVKRQEWQDEDVKPYMAYNIERTYDSGKEGEGSFGQFLQSSERYEVMQFTGLKDKNGKEIYEGDVMQNEDGVGRSLVEWNHCGFNRRWIPIGVTSPLSLNTEQWEVIGNIYENPELLA